MKINKLITEHMEVWTTAQAQKRNGGRGRTSNVNDQSPHGIKKLRELILELAVRGKLVPQDPNDEPASVLLERIAKEKKRLIKEGKIKKQKPLPEIGEGEKPFRLPKGWGIVRLGEITNRIGSGSTPRGGKNAYVDSGVPFLRSQNVWNHGLEIKDVAFIPEETHQIMSNTVVLPKDILLNITGASLGRCAIFPDFIEEANVSQHVTIIRPTDSSTRFFLHLCILSPYTQGLIWGRQVGMAREGLSKKVLELFEIPIPPLAEQHRIVGKVNELMTLCDQLEQQQTDSNATHQTLVETLLTALTSAADAKTFAQTWQRIADHFDTLFSTEASIDHLKQTILQLAVMGKLVPQNPNDEPASMLLEKIAREKKRLIKEGKIKKQKPLPEIGENEKPFELPKGWVWVRLQTIIQISSGDGLTSAKMNKEGGIPVYGGNGITGYHDKANVTKPTLVIGRVGYYCGSIHVTPSSAWITDNAFITKFSEENIFLNFLSWLLKGTDLKEKENATAQPVISGRKIYPIIVGLPPHAEQHRIVAKLDELVTLCDKIKACLNQTQTTQLQLADAIVEQAVA